MCLKRWGWIGLICLLVWLMPQKIAAAETTAPTVSGEAAVLYCANTGAVLYGKNETEPRAMASTTKIMTALLTLEAAAQENKVFTVPESVALVEGSSMGLSAGDQLTLRDLAAGMLSVSGNDAAEAAAIAVSGSVPQFVQKMNERAAELGLSGTHFVTPSGLDAEGHASTALDLAKLAAEALKNQDFRALCSAPSVTVDWVTPNKTVTLQNHNRLLSQYEGCIGVKTGYTQKAGRCLVSAAERNGILLIAVTLSAPDDWNDHQKLLDYGFSRLTAETPQPVTTSIPVVGGTGSSVTVSTEAAVPPLVLEAGETVQVKIAMQKFLYAPVAKGELVGTVEYLVAGEIRSVLPLRATDDVGAEAQKQSVWKRIWQGW